MDRLMLHSAGSEGKPTVYQTEGLILALWYLYNKCLAAQAELLAAAVATASGKPRLGWEVHAQLSGSFCPHPVLLPRSLLSSTSKRRTTFMLPFLSPPMPSTAVKPNRACPWCWAWWAQLRGLQCWGVNMKMKGEFLYKGRLLHGLSCYPHRGYMNMGVCAGCRFPQGQEEEYWNLYPVPAGTNTRLPFWGRKFRITIILP